MLVVVESIQDHVQPRVATEKKCFYCAVFFSLFVLLVDVLLWQKNTEPTQFARLPADNLLNIYLREHQFL